MMNGLKSQIISQGQVLSSNIINLDITKVVNKIPYAQVTLCDGGKDEKTVVELSTDPLLRPGGEISITLAQEDKSDIFKGVVLKHTLKKTSGASFLIIEIKDTSVKLTLQRLSAVFYNKEDKQIIADIAKKKNITVDCAEQTYTHKQLVQYYCTDWDFIVSRAEANGLLVYVENGVLLLKKPAISSVATQLNEVYEFEIEADLSSQYKETAGVCWDIKEAKLSAYKNTNGSETYLESGHDSDELAQLMGTESCVMVNGIYAEKEEMELWANAQFARNRLSLIRGRVSINGSPTIKLGDTISIAQAGEQFDSTTIVTGIRHRINKNGWTTDLQCGLSAEWFYKNDDIIEKPAAGLVPGINGLQVGIVEAFPADGDPEKFHRVKVRVPAVAEKDSVIWARLLFPYAGAKRGMFFVPEEGDEVVIGFFNDDPRHAVILGALYNGKTDTPLNFTDKNNEKGIITRNGIKLVFTDEKDKEKIEISTPAHNKVLIEDEKGIIIEDKNKNKITFHDKGVSFLDKNKNKITTDDKGLIVEDFNKNQLSFSNKGIEIKDMNNNIITLGSKGIEIKDKNGNITALEGNGISVQSKTNVKIEGGSQVGIKGPAINMN